MRWYGWNHGPAFFKEKHRGLNRIKFWWSPPPIATIESQQLCKGNTLSLSFQLAWSSKRIGDFTSVQCWISIYHESGEPQPMFPLEHLHQLWSLPCIPGIRDHHHWGQLTTCIYKAGWALSNRTDAQSQKHHHGLELKQYPKEPHKDIKLASSIYSEEPYLAAVSKQPIQQYCMRVTDHDSWQKTLTARNWSNLANDHHQ